MYLAWWLCLSQQISDSHEMRLSCPRNVLHLHHSKNANYVACKTNSLPTFVPTKYESNRCDNCTHLSVPEELINHRPHVLHPCFAAHAKQVQVNSLLHCTQGTHAIYTPQAKASFSPAHIKVLLKPKKKKKTINTNT